MLKISGADGDVLYCTVHCDVHVIHYAVNYVKHSVFNIIKIAFANYMKF